MSVHRETNAESLTAARDRARELWEIILDREAAIKSNVFIEVDIQPKRHEAIANEQSRTVRHGMILSIAAQRIAGDKKLKDLTAEYDRVVATATMYGVARLAELFGDGFTVGE